MLPTEKSLQAVPYLAPFRFSVAANLGENDQDEAVASSCGLFAVPADADSSESLSGAPLLSLSADAEWGWQT